MIKRALYVVILVSIWGCTYVTYVNSKSCLQHRWGEEVSDSEFIGLLTR